MSNENIIEVINTDYVISIDEPEYKLGIDNLYIADYSYSPNKPQINSVELTGNKTAEELNLASKADVANKENVSNKVVSIDAQSTDTQYPSAKCVYTGLSSKANSSDVYSKADVYTKSEVYTKAEVYTKTDIYTKAETNGLMTDKLSATVPHIVNKKEPTSSDRRGYVVYSDGYCEQWGYFTKNSSGGTTVSYVKTFANTNYLLLKNGTSNFDGGTTTLRTTGWTSTDVNAAVNTKYSGYWLAQGWLAQGEY